MTIYWYLMKCLSIQISTSQFPLSNYSQLFAKIMQLAWKLPTISFHSLACACTIFPLNGIIIRIKFDLVLSKLKKMTPVNWADIFTKPLALTSLAFMQTFVWMVKTGDSSGQPCYFPTGFLLDKFSLGCITPESHLLVLYVLAHHFTFMLSVFSCPWVQGSECLSFIQFLCLATLGWSVPCSSIMRGSHTNIHLGLNDNNIIHGIISPWCQVMGQSQTFWPNPSMSS